MVSLSANERSILGALGEWSHEIQNHGLQSVLLARLPFRLPVGVSLTEHEVPPLPLTSKNRFNLYPHHWPEFGLQSSYVPVLLFILEGEADILIGATQQMLDNARHSEDVSPEAVIPESGRMVFAVPEGHLVVVPEGVPHSDGLYPHWFRPHMERANCRILWVMVTPEGAICHTCRTVRGEHKHQEHLMLRDPQLAPLTALFIEEIQTWRRCQQETAQALLHGLLLHLQDGFSEGRTHKLEAEIRLFEANSSRDEAHFFGPVAFKRACKFIRFNLENQLSVGKIAQHAQLSPTHLNRLFRTETEMSVMQYVAHHRMEAARSLLLNTQLSIDEVAKLTGYTRLSHFSHAFAQSTGVAPTQFRKQQLSESMDEK